MKVLIVDDEKHVRNAINLLADWKTYGITEVAEASDGEQAVSLIETLSPQIVLTDMKMPRKDGAELLTWLHTNRPHIKVIVISGHDEFEYVRHTIRTGGMDYLLKPVKADILNEALNNATNCWLKEEEARQRLTQQSIEVNEMKPHYVDKLLTDLVTGQTRRDLLNQLHEDIHMPMPLSSCSVAVLSISQLDQKLLEKFQGQTMLLFFIISNICNELLKSKGIAFRHLNSSSEIVIFYWDDRGSFTNLLKGIDDGIYATLNCRVHFGVATKRILAEQLSQAYIEASKALWSRNLLDYSSRVHVLGDTSIQLTRPLRLTTFEEQLRLTALSGKQEQFELITEKWLDHIRKLGIVTPEQLIEWDNEWDWMQIKWFESESKETHTIERETSRNDFSHPLHLNEDGLLQFEQLSDQMKNRLGAASKILTQLHKKDHLFIHDIAKYVENHFQEDISLQDVASRFFLSREYIARKFKQEYGVTLLDYLSRIRIDKSKILLHNPHLRIAQVAEMVGYQDEKYFSKVFKKLEGINPGEYRKDQA
ncbi:response regulator [Paenibacillus sp. GSMTC-2017]|uniref:response regulator transcription factor n=1 Tax=Paenibacillus sp. GSMTC-2017 TaxID=2794350 RepID=UPI0018D974F1|nr:response regulator [Paenibacillus sp. GSMTC-2017]MBH5317270.1 response regulator [Paenibacillus sp. GSMTC-2017]